MDAKLKEKLGSIKNIFLVLSGKGGVGKSTCSVQLATSLARSGKKVGICDIDICGPSIPTMLGVTKEPVYQSEEGWVPIEVGKNLKVMSIGFLLPNADDPVIWRGPRKHAMISAFFSDVQWGELDYLVVDTPPGTSDEHISIMQMLKPLAGTGAVLVTTPQKIALSDVRKEANFCRKLDFPVFGVLENMSGFVCPDCGDVQYIFKKGGGEQLAVDFSVPFLGRIPLDPKMGEQLDTGADLINPDPASTTLKVWDPVAKLLLDLLGN